MINVHKHTRIVLLIAIIFLSPLFLALVVHQNPEWLGSPVNKGTWLEQPVRIADAKAGQYSMVYYPGPSCDDACIRELDKLARARLALGRRLYQVDLILLLPEGQSQDQRIGALGYKIIAVPADNQLRQQTFYLGNPQQELMLAYPAPLKAKDIFTDVQRLLKQADS